MQLGRRVLDSLFAFVGVLTPDGELTEANRAPLLADVFGRKLWEYYWFNYDPEVQSLARDLVARASRGEVSRGDIVVRVDATQFATIHLMVAPLLNDRGAVTHLVASAVDITERKQIEDALRQSEARLVLAVDAASMGLYDRVETDGGKSITLDARAKDLVGLGPSETDWAFENWLIRLHPDDARWVAELDRQLADGRTNQALIEYRYRHPVRGWVWLYHVARVIDRGPYGRRRREIGLIQDITVRKRAEEVTIRQAMILEATPDCVATATPDRKIVFMNHALAWLVGATDPAAFDLWTLTQLHPTWAAQVVAEEGIPTALRDGFWSGETAIQAADGREVPTSQTIIAHRDRSGELLHLSTIMRDLTQSRELERRVSQAVDGEQLRIGQELHDGVGQEMTGLALMADVLVKRLHASAPAEAALATAITAGLERIRENVRGLSRGLVPVELDPEGLRSSLQDMVARTAERPDVTSSFQCVGDVGITDPTTATQLFRIAQEAFGNALRHSNASRIDILLQDHGNQVALTVRDNGRGLPVAAARRGGLGLRIMQHRAGLVGGGMQFLPASGGGTVVVCSIPKRTGRE